MLQIKTYLVYIHRMQLPKQLNLAIDLHFVSIAKLKSMAFFCFQFKWKWIRMLKWIRIWMKRIGNSKIILTNPMTMIPHNGKNNQAASNRQTLTLESLQESRTSISRRGLSRIWIKQCQISIILKKVRETKKKQTFFNFNTLKQF